jgi:hypothetical protein
MVSGEPFFGMKDHVPDTVEGKVLEVPTVAEVPVENGQVPVRSVAHDAFRVCLTAMPRR